MWVALTLFGLLMLGSLAAQLYTVRQQRIIQINQERVAKELNRQALPLLRATRPLIEDAAGRRDEVRAAARRADDLVRETAPLVERLDQAGAPAAIAEGGRLAAALRRAGAPGAIAQTGNLAAALARGNRLVELTDRTDRVLRELEQAQTIDDVRRVAGIAAELLSLQRRALAVQRETLAVQKEALVHIRSLDRKTGGPAPGVAPTR